MSGPEKVGELYLEATLRAEQIAAEAKKGEQALQGLSDAAQKTQKDLDGASEAAEKSGVSLGKYGVAAGAAAAAIVAVGAAAVAMAKEVDEGITRATTLMPQLANSASAVRDEIAKLSRESGESQRTIVDALVTAAESGVESFSELQQVMRASVDVASATGFELRTTVAGLDVALDAFGLSAENAGESAAKLFAATQGRVPFTDLTAAIQRAVPTIKELNLGFDVTVAALANLLASGRNPAQAAKELKDLAAGGAAGAAEMRELAGELVPVGEAMDRLGAAAKASREDAAGLSRVLRAELQGELIRLGNEILPTVNSALRTTIDLLRTARQIAGTGSMFEGLEIKIPDSGPQLRTFIESTRAQIADVQKQLREAEAAARDAEKIKPVDLLSPGGISSRPGRTAEANAAVKLLKDESAALTAALSTAERQLKSLIATGGKLPDIVVTGNKPTESELKRAGSNAEKIDKAISGMQAKLRLATAALEGPFARALADLDEQVRASLEGLEGLTDTQKQKIVELGDALKKAATDARIDDILGATTPKVEINQASFLDRINRDIKDLPDNLEKVSEGVQQVRDEFGRLTGISTAMAEVGNYAFVAASGADELANALREVGALSPDLEALLGIIGQMADGIANFANLSGTIADFKLGNASTLDVIGSAVPFAGSVASIAGAIAGAFGDSPEIKAAREALESMRAALEENTLSLRQLDLSGEEISGTNSGIQRFLDEGLPGLRNRPRISISGIEDELEKFGVTMDDLRDLAAELGVPFIELTRATLPQFLEQLGLFGEALDDLAFFASDAAGRLDKARTTIQFTPEVETVGQTIQQLIEAAMGSNGPLTDFIGSFFEGFDFGDLDSLDPEVRANAEAAFREIIGSIFSTISADGFDLSQLGDFTPDEFLAFLSEVLGFIPPIIEDAAGDIETASSLFAQAMASISRAARVFDFTDLEIAGATLNAMAASFPAFADAIAGFDLSTPEGIAAAIQSLQAFFSAVDEGTISLDGAGFSVDDLVAVIDQLQQISADAADEVERLAEEERRRAEQTQREAEQAYREQQRRQEELQREAERAHAEAMRRAEERRRIELALGSDTLRALQEAFQLFDIDDQVEQLRQIFTVLSSQAPVFQNLLGGLNAGSAGDRAEALQRLRDFQLANPFGQESGNLSADAVRAQVLSVAEILKSLNEVDITSEGVVGSFAIDRSITELRGERLEGLLGISNTYLSEIAAATAFMASLMAPQSFGALAVPAIPAGFGAGAGVAIGTMVFQFPGSPGQVVTNPAVTPGLRAFIAEVVEQERLRNLGA